MQYYVNFEDYASKSGSTYTYNQFRYDENYVYWIRPDVGLATYEGYKVTLQGANVNLSSSSLFGRQMLFDTVKFPNGGKIIIEWPKCETPDYTKPCFSFFSAWVHEGGYKFRGQPGFIFSPQEDGEEDCGRVEYYSRVVDANGNTIDQTGRVEINVPAGVKFGCNFTFYGFCFMMGMPAKVAVQNQAQYWWETGSEGDPEGNDLEYSGAEQQLLKPHKSIAVSGNFWSSGGIGVSYQNFYYRWRKTDHDGSNPTIWSEWSQEEPAATEVGRYEMQYYVQTNVQGMYGNPGSQEAGEHMEQPIVSRILRTITDINDPMALTPMYNFHAQPLITAGTSSQGIYMYKSVIVAQDEGQEVEYVLQNWSSTVPTATEVGNYRVYWYISGDPTRFYKDSGNTFEPKGSTDVTIVPLDLATTTMTVTNNNYTYDGQPHVAVVDVKCGAETVDFNCYSITYGPDKTDVNETETGDYDVTITAKDGYPNFKGTQTKGKLSIGKFNISQSLGNLQPRLYISQKIEPTMEELPTIKLLDNTTVISSDEYEITAYGENINAGTGTVTITAKDGSNYTGSRILEFDINKREVTVTANAQSIIYNTDGQFHSSGVNYGTLTLVDGYTDGYSLAGVNHTLKSVIFTSEDTEKGVGTYSGSIIPANAKIKNNNGDDVTANYIITYAAGPLTIARKNTNSDALTLSGIQEEYKYTGTGILPSPQVRDNGKPLSSADYDVAYSDNTAIGDEALVTVTFKGNYEGTLTKTFKIYYEVDAYERTNDTKFYRTYYNNSEDLEIRHSTKFSVFKGSLNDDKTKVKLTDVGNVIPKQTAVMLVATETPVKLYKKSDTNSAGDFDGNILLGGNSATLDGSEKYFIFTGDAFVWATEGTMEASKAYINGSASGHNLAAARQLSITFDDDETTGITASSPQSTVNSEDHWYDLMGNSIDKPTRKGLYIKNGHKVVVK